MYITDRAVSWICSFACPRMNPGGVPSGRAAALQKSDGITQHLCPLRAHALHTLWQDRVGGRHRFLSHQGTKRIRSASNTINKNNKTTTKETMPVPAAPQNTSAAPRPTPHELVTNEEIDNSLETLYQTTPAPPPTNATIIIYGRVRAASRAQRSPSAPRRTARATAPSGRCHRRQRQQGQQTTQQQQHLPCAPSRRCRNLWPPPLLPCRGLASCPGVRNGLLSPVRPETAR